MSYFMFTGITDSAGVESFCGVFGSGRFVFPGANWDAQIDSALAFVDALDAGVGDAVEWIESNLTSFAGNPGWASDLFAEFFADATEIMVGTTVVADLEALIDAGEVSDAASFAEVMDADEGTAFTDALVTVIESLAAA